MKTLASVGVAVLAVVFVACGGFGGPKKEANVETVKDTKGSKGKAAEPAERWAVAGKESASLGTVRVSVQSALVDHVTFESFGSGSSKDKLLMVKLEITNTSDSKKINYRGWAGNAFTTDSRLTDDIGNNYKSITFGLGSRINGQVHGSESLYPGKSITDLLVFEEPVDKAKSFKLTLPGKNIDEDDGVIRFQLPPGFVKR